MRDRIRAARCVWLLDELLYLMVFRMILVSLSILRRFWWF
jgi:hypothetical protein